MKVMDEKLAVASIACLLVCISGIAPYPVRSEVTEPRAQDSTDVFQNLHQKLASGARVSADDANSLSKELNNDLGNPFKHAVAGEVLLSLGLYDQAEAQYETADRLKKDYMRAMFSKELFAEHHTLRFLSPYVQKVAPKDSALLFYLANRDLAAAMIKQDIKTLSLQPLIDEFTVAASSSEPWPGTRGTLSMLEYNEAIRQMLHPLWSQTARGNTPQALFNRSLRHAEEELKTNPNDPKALRFYLIGIDRTSGKIDKETIERISNVAGLDPQINLMLAKMCMANKDYHAAVRPALLSCMSDLQKAVREAKSFNDISPLINRSDSNELMVSALNLINTVGWGSPQGGFICLRIADLFSACGRTMEEIALLEIAINRCGREYFQIIMFKLGKAFLVNKQFDRAAISFDIAYKQSPLGSLSSQILPYRYRAVQQAKNAHRDIALQIKRRLQFR